MPSCLANCARLRCWPGIPATTAHGIGSIHQVVVSGRDLPVVRELMGVDVPRVANRAAAGDFVVSSTAAVEQLLSTVAP
jgi:hypothetical protein